MGGRLRSCSGGTQYALHHRDPHVVNPANSLDNADPTVQWEVSDAGDSFIKIQTRAIPVRQLRLRHWVVFRRPHQPHTCLPKGRGGYCRYRRSVGGLKEQLSDIHTRERIAGVCSLHHEVNEYTRLLLL